MTEPYRRVWVVLSHDEGDPWVVSARDSFLAALETTYEKVRQEQFTGIRILLYESSV